MEEPRKKLILSGIFILLIISSGTIGYMVIEKWNLLDSIYMTITTLSTVGYREVHDLSDTGRIFTAILIVSGVGTVLYVFTSASKLVLEGKLQEIFGRKNDIFLFNIHNVRGRLDEIGLIIIKYVVLRKEDTDAKDLL